MSSGHNRDENQRETLHSSQRGDIDVSSTLGVQAEKSARTEAAQQIEPIAGAEAVRQGFAPRHEPAKDEMRDSLAERAGHDHSDHGDDGHHILPLSTYLKVFAALMILLVLTLLVYYFDPTHMLPPAFSWFGITVAMIVAIVKAVLVILFFMHVKYSTKMTWVFASASFVFVAIMFVLTLSDYFTRGLLETAGR